MLVKADDYKEQPWKNGGGLTREIAADDFWRVSIATIDRDGPFSEFPGYDRTIVAIEGTVELQIDGETIELVPNQPFEFAGEKPVVARVRGRARDLNVMTRRDQMAHDVEIVEGTQRFVLDEDEFAFVYAIDGETRVDGMEIAAGDTLAAEDIEALTVQTSGHAAVIRLIDL